MDIKWESFIKKESNKRYFKELMAFLDKEYLNGSVFPDRENIYKSLELVDYDRVKCVIIGQDPYFNRGQAQGLAFSVPDDIKRPPSLVNIFKELETDLGICRKNNDLASWGHEGVLLLNRVLTVREGEANSHKKSGWQIFTKEIIKYLSDRDKPMVFILWGGEAGKLEKIIDGRHQIIKSPHPSPLSSYRGFFGSKPFSKCNDFLLNIGDNKIDWR